MSSKLIVDTIEDATGTYSLALGSGNSTFPGGIHIGGTGSANLLDDYEKGSWTPTLIGSTSNPTVTYTYQRGTYVKIGDLVSFAGFIYTSVRTGGSGNALIGGLPFTVYNGASPDTDWYVFSPGYCENFSSTKAPTVLMATGGETRIHLWTHNSSDSRDNRHSRITTADWPTGNTQIYFSGTYVTA